MASYDNAVGEWG